jgi:hypothetical protein
MKYKPAIKRGSAKAIENQTGKLIPPVTATIPELSVEPF